MAFKPEPDAFYSIKELTESRVASKPTLRGWIKSGKLKGVRIGRKYVVSGKNLIEFLSGGQQSGGQQAKKRRK